MTTLIKSLQSLNAKECMKRTLLGITNSPVNDVGASIKTNFLSLSYRTPFSSLGRFVQTENAEYPMLFTLLGIFIEVNAEHFQNDSSPIRVTPSGISTEVKPVQLENVPGLMEVTLEGITIEVNFEQPKNAQAPIETTLLGITTEVKFLQPKNAEFPM
jgi:hypothetical protein